MRAHVLAAVLLLLFSVVGRASSPDDAVWNPPADLMDRLHAALERAEPAEALARVMRESGARPAALAFARRFTDDAGFLAGQTARGSVKIGSVCFPLRASNSAEPCAVDARDRLVRPAGPDQVDAGELARDRRFRVLARKETLEAYPPLEEPRVVGGARGAFELIYEHPLRSCPRCPARGVVRVAHRFDGAGIYEGRRVVKVDRKASGRRRP